MTFYNLIINGGSLKSSAQFEKLWHQLVVSEEVHVGTSFVRQSTFVTFFVFQSDAEIFLHCLEVVSEKLSVLGETLDF